MIFCFFHMDNATAEDDYEDADYENSDQSNITAGMPMSQMPNAAINQSDSHNRPSVTNEDEQVKEKVISVVDNMLRISRQKEMTVNDPKIKKLLKEQDITKQMTELREQMRMLEKTIDTHYTQASKDKKKYAKYVESDDAKNSKDKSLTNKKHRHRGKDKSRLDVYTVKQNKRHLSNKYKPNYIAVRTNNVTKHDSIKTESNYLKANDSSCGCSVEI